MRSAKDTMRRHLQFALIWTVLLAGSAAAWSVMAPLDGAIVTQGTVIVESNVKKVQHPTGGVVGQIHVKEGQRVSEGDIVMRLDETVTRANLGIVLNDLTAQRMRLARLAAERDNTASFEVPVDIAQRALKEPEVRMMIDGERQLLRTRLTTRNGQKAQLRERVGQLQQEIKGLEEQRKAAVFQLALSRDELRGLKGLEAKGLVQKPRVNGLEREISRSDGGIGELAAKTAQAQGRISETELQVLQLDKDSASDVAKDLRETETRIGELQERRVSAEDQLKRVDIRAPITGVVHQLNTHTIGGVINQTEPLMLIVPDADRLIVEVRINPQDIDQIRLGQEARVRFSAFNQSTTPEVNGTLVRLAGDLVREPQTGLAYYTGAVAVTDGDMNRLGGVKLIPGMPAEIYIKTGERTLASYLLKPLTDQIQRGLRER